MLSERRVLYLQHRSFDTVCANDCFSWIFVAVAIMLDLVGSLFFFDW